MKRTLPSAAIALSLVCGFSLPSPTRAEGQHNGAAPKPEAPEPEIKVTAVSVKAGRAEGVVEAPIEAVRKVVEDYGSYEKFMPHFKASRVLSRRGASALVYMQASIAKDTMTLWAQLKITPKPSVGSMQVIEAKMVQGNMDAMFARWELTPVDAKHTLVAFQLLMDPKVPLPASLVQSENEKATQKTIRALRRVVAERASLASNEKH
ncbi:MAG TPA: SRPBCC family protein [Polyangiales bacterium]|nr:SRPBCC family protein [Polyangiales bacterium]